MKQQTIKFEEFDVTIKELRIKDILKVISNVKEVFSDEDLDLHKLVEEKFDTIVDIASGFIVITSGSTLDDLTFSDIDKLVEPFKEVNASFLDKLSSMGLTFGNLMPDQMALDPMPTLSEEDSTTQSQP